MNKYFHFKVENCNVFTPGKKSLSKEKLIRSKVHTYEKYLSIFKENVNF